MKIGADELILWLRKNNKANLIQNIDLGRRIGNLICKELDGKLVEENKISYWALDSEDTTTTRINLPRTSAQYEIDVNKLPTLFLELETW